MSRHNQLLSGVQVKHLAFTSGNSSAVQVNSANGLFGGVTFLVNFALAASSAIKVQDSADGSTWADLTVGYQVSTTFGTPITAVPAVPGAAISASATTAATNQYLAISVNHPGKDSAVQSSNITPFVSRPYMRVVATTGTATYGVALLHNSNLAPVPQPDVAIETKGTN